MAPLVESPVSLAMAQAECFLRKISRQQSSLWRPSGGAAAAVRRGCGGNRPGPGGPPGAVRSRMTYPHTLPGTDKWLGTIEERWARFYFRPNTWSKYFLSVKTLFLRPHSGPIYAVMEVPPTSMTHQCACLTPCHGSRAVTARRERSSASYEPLK